MAGRVLLLLLMAEDVATDVVALLALGDGAACSVSTDVRSGHAVFQPMIGYRCNTSRFLSNTQLRSDLMTVAGSFLEPSVVNRMNCLVLGLRATPRILWIKTRASQLPSLGSVCSFPSDCLGALHQMNRSFWEWVPTEQTLSTSTIVDGRYQLTISSLSSSAFASRSGFYYHCIVDRDHLCAQSPIAVIANRRLFRPTMKCSTALDVNSCFSSVMDRVFRMTTMFGTDCALLAEVVKTMFGTDCALLAEVVKVLRTERSFLLSQDCLVSVVNLICAFLCDFNLNQCEMVWRHLDDKYRYVQFWPRCGDLPTSELVHFEVIESETISSAPVHDCQRWDTQCPVEHNFLVQVYPELHRYRMENHCLRDRISGSNFCMDTASMPGHSRLVSCTQSNAVISESFLSQTWSLAFFLPFMVVLVSLMAIKGVIFWRRYSIEKRDDIETSTSSSEMQQLSLTRNELYYTPEEPSCPLPVIVKKISSGPHSEVFLGQLKGQMIAVKTISATAPQCALWKEWRALRSIGEHEHLISMLGQCQRPPALLFHFMPSGDLCSMLRAMARDENKDMVLTLSEQLELLRQAARGLGFVHSHGWLHRDIAARNCLIDRGLRLRVSDFGMAVEVNGEGCFKDAFNTEFAIRWAAPEVLQQRHYSYASDCWAFAVLAWEVFSMGQVPYYGMSAIEISESVIQGEHLQRPIQCPNQFWSILSECFLVESTQRMPLHIIERHLTV